MPRASKAKSDDNTSILEYALSHLERESSEIQAKIDHIKSQLGRPGRVSAPTAASTAATEEESPAASAAPGARKKRVLSPAARKRIALAQKRRWAEHRKAKAAKA